jgi:VanZ family protein
MSKDFSEITINKKRARLLAITWTLLIFFLCFLPARDVPKVNVPLADKWVHFILFGVFSFLWLLSFKGFTIKDLFLIFAASVTLGWLVEFFQGILTFLGRSRDSMDILADSIGGLLGVVVFYAAYRLKHKRK